MTDRIGYESASMSTRTRKRSTIVDEIALRRIADGSFIASVRYRDDDRGYRPSEEHALASVGKASAFLKQQFG